MIVTFALFDVLAAPATVLDHTLDVSVDYRRRLSMSQTWTVRIDDPEACVAGLPAPPGLDGATDGGAIVLEDLFVVPPDVQAGTTYTLTASIDEGAGSHSGVFASAVGLPVDHARVTIKGPSRQPLTVWADAGADAIWSTSRGKSAELEWNSVPEGRTANAVFSTWQDWTTAGVALERAVDDALADKSELGRELGQNLKSTNLTELVRRTMEAIDLEPGLVTGWEDARPASELASARVGSPAERGLVLLSVLRLAGYEARPALYRPASEGEFPITVPAPALLDHALVVVKNTAGKTFWIDPANDAVAVPQLPSGLPGSTIWIPGSLPRRFDEGGAAAGTVELSTAATAKTDGEVTWTTEIVPTGAAIEAIRSLLNSLDENGRTQALERLVRQGRPDLERFVVTSSGTTDPYRPLKIQVSGADKKVFEPFGLGVRGEIVPVLGPAMAGWLPPNIRIHETIDVTPPGTNILLATRPLERSVSEDALVDRKVSRRGGRVRVEVDAIRPYSVATAERDGAGAAFLAEQAGNGVDVVLYPPASGKTAKSLRSTEGGTALEALLWWGVDNDKKARGLLKKALKTTPPPQLAEGFSTWAVPGDERPWAALFDLTENPEMRLAILERAADHGVGPWAAEQAPQLLGADEERDARIWLLIGSIKRDPGTFGNVAKAKGTGDIATRLAELQAEWNTERLKPADLSAVPTDTAERRGLHLVAEAGALPRSTLRRRVRELRAEAPLSAKVARRASEALLAGGLMIEGSEAALDAARIAHDDPSMWAHCAEAALLAGRLGLALDAARQASDLRPEDSVYARRLHHLATLSRDDELEQLARERSGGEQPADWPPTVDDLLGIAEPSALLAVLQYHDDEVLASPTSLALRAQLRTDAGLLDEAARDSIVLYERHDQPEGPALAFAATVGRVLGHGTLALLDEASDDVAKLTRMEYRLITQSSDPRNDARALRDQPRAADVLAAAGDPKSVAARVEGWPELTNQWMRAPRGYRTNSILSGPDGVNGFSHTDRQVALIHVNGETDLLPPPLAVLYTLQQPPIAEDEAVTLYRLTDGYLPLYGARMAKDGATVWGVGFTAESARRALQDL